MKTVKDHKQLVSAYLEIFRCINKPTAIALGVTNLAETVRQLRKSEMPIFTVTSNDFGTHYVLATEEDLA